MTMNNNGRHKLKKLKKFTYIFKLWIPKTQPFRQRKIPYTVAHVDCRRIQKKTSSSVPVKIHKSFFFMNNNLLKRKGKFLIHEKYTRETTILKVSRI